MNITILKSKIHKATITQGDTQYEGSITIDSSLMDKIGLCLYEKVLVSNITQGTRFETYAIKGEPGSGQIILNGAAAHLGKIGDIITIMSFTQIPADTADKYRPKKVLLDKNNKIKRFDD